MNVDINLEKINSCKVIAKEKKVKVVEGELIVSDIKPDILSLSTIDAEVYLTNKFIKDGSVSIDGALDICAIYISEDETASLKSLNNVFNFQDTIMIDGLNESSNVSVKLYRGTIEYKIINSRKIGVKVPITIETVATNSEESLVAKDIVDDRSIQTLKERYTLNTMLCCKEQEIQISENVTLDEGAVPIGEILKATMKIENPEYKVSYNKILVKADAIIKIIYIADSNTMSVEVFEKTLPIMGFVESEGINSDDEIKLEFDIKSFVIRPIYQDLKSMSFGVESEVRAYICTYQKNEIEILSDVYSPEMNLKCELEKIEINQNVISKNECVQIKQEVPVQDLENARILNVVATPAVTKNSVLDEKVMVEGALELDVLYFNQNTNTIEVKKLEVPIAQSIRVEKLKANMNPEIKIDVGNIACSKTSLNSVEVQVPLCVKVDVSKRECINGIKSVEVSDEKLAEISSLIIYYVKEGDSLWKIAKKYRTTVEDIMRYNDLTDDKIFPGDQLMIVKKTRCKAVELL